MEWDKQHGVAGIPTRDLAALVDEGGAGVRRTASDAP